MKKKTGKNILKAALLLIAIFILGYPIYTFNAI